MILTIALIALYIATLLLIGWRDNKDKSKDSFIIADRKVSVLGFLSSTSASFRDGGGLTNTIGMGFLLGYGMYDFYLGLIAGMIIMSFCAPRVREIASKKGYVTIFQMVKDIIGKRTEKLSSIIIVIACFLLLSLQFYVFGNIFSAIFNIDKLVSVLVSFLIVFSYVSLGGYKTIVKTDIIQFFILLLPIVFLFFIPLNIEDVLNYKTLYQNKTTTDFILNFLFGIILVLSMGDFWQRVFSAKNAQTAKKGLQMSIVGFLLISLPMTWIGMSAKEFLPMTTNPNNVMTLILTGGYYPKIMLSLFALVIISTIMSTIDTYSYLISSTILEDLWQAKKSKKQYINRSRYAIFLILLLGAISSFYIESAIAYLFALSGVFMILAPLFLLVTFEIIKKTSKMLDTCFVISLLIPLCLGLYWIGTGFLLETLLKPLIIVAISFVLCLITFLLYKFKMIK